jgi:hypothetical protein
MEQLNKADELWKCPVCGSPADWDDDWELEFYEQQRA